MRSSPFSKMSVFLSLVLMVGCAASLSNLQRAEKAYEQSEAEKKKEEEKVRAAQAQADAARQAETTAKEGLAIALVTDAQQREQYVQDELRLAKEARDRACTLNPKLEGCKKVEPPPPGGGTQPPPPVQAQQPAAAPPPTVQTPPPPTNPPAVQAPAELSHVDVRMDDFTAAGMHRLSALPVGWEVGYDATKGNIYLEIDGVEKYQRSKPAQFKPGICYRFKAETVEACPAATAPPPGP